jgi:hypothetical protein
MNGTIEKVTASVVFDAEQHAGHHARQQRRPDQAEDASCDGQLERLAQHHPQDARALGAERHAHADVVRTLRHEVRHHAVDADDRQDQREQREGSQHQRGEALPRHRGRHPCGHRLHVEDGDRRIDLMDLADHVPCNRGRVR